MLNPTVDPDPIVDPDPVVEIDSATTGDVPAVDANASKIETADTVEEIYDNSVSLTSGKDLWFNSETIIKYNDASGFEVGQLLEFKAWSNPDGTLIGIKVEVAE